MTKYHVQMLIEFSGELEAESEAGAIDLAWSSWGDSSDSPITYDGVYSIEADEITEDEDDEDDEEDEEEE